MPKGDDKCSVRASATVGVRMGTGRENQERRHMDRPDSAEMRDVRTVLVADITITMRGSGMESSKLAIDGVSKNEDSGGTQRNQ